MKHGLERRECGTAVTGHDRHRNRVHLPDQLALGEMAGKKNPIRKASLAECTNEVRRYAKAG